MIAAALRDDIQRYAHEMRGENRLFVGAARGVLTRTTITLYLANLHELICNSQRHLRVARDTALARGLLDLAAYYAEKCVEEQGHDAWAVADMSRVAPKSARGAVLPATRERIERLDAIIEEDPELYLTYTLFAEYVTVLLGGDWLDLLEANCGIPRTSMTVVRNHVDLDKEHVAEALERIDALVSDPRKITRMRQVLRESFALFDRFGAEICAHAEVQDLRHVPAA
ncbi:MAG TPA: hypothetical protein VGM56_05070 [Byssovorax sp.]|jgi:hypothetical protein